MDITKDEAYYASLDKRTKEYKDWVESQQKRGLGDKIEEFTEKTGIKKAVEAVSDALGIEDCGCNARKEAINNFEERIRSMFIHKQPKLLTEEEFVFLRDFFAVNRTRITADEQREVYHIYNRIFDTNIQPSMCPSCWRNAAHKLQKLIELQRK